MSASLPLVSDLAPGDAKSAGLDLAAFTIHRIRGVDDTHFEAAYARLWAEFGSRQEMERRETLAMRFGLAPSMQYEIVLVERAGVFAAVRDYTVIPSVGTPEAPNAGHPERSEGGKTGGTQSRDPVEVTDGMATKVDLPRERHEAPRGPSTTHRAAFARRGASLGMTRVGSIPNLPNEETVVHLSHIFVAPDFRRSGLAGWMRALPVAAARELAADIPIILVAEMEYDDGSDPARTIRLRAYEKAGFRKVDPHVVHFHQPDFRAPAEVDATGVQPVPFQLCLRCVGDENATTISGARLRRIVGALYRMYRPQFRAQDMAHPALDLAHYPADEATIALLPPTA